MNPIVNTLVIAGIILAMAIDAGVAICRDYLRRQKEWREQ